MMRNIKIKLTTFLMILSLVTIAIPGAVFADSSTNGLAGGSCNGSAAIFPHWYDNGLCSGGKILGPNDLSPNNTSAGLKMWLSKIALNIVSMILYVVGYVSLAFIIWGGFKYMINGDNSSGTVAARKTIQNAVIGLVLSIMSVSIVVFVTQHI